MHIGFCEFINGEIMKFKLLSLMNIVALAISLSLAACGSKDDNKNNNNVPAPGAGTSSQYQSYPVGSYYNGYGGYSPCGPGYVQQGNMCVYSGNANVVCPQNMTWNGTGCVPSGWNNGSCPTGYTWNQMYGYCMCATGTSGTNGCNGGWNTGGYTCQSNGWFYYCRYTSGAPYGGCYFNGYGWVCQ